MHNGIVVGEFRDTSLVLFPPLLTATSAATANLLRVNRSGGAVQQSTSQVRVKDGFEPIDDPVGRFMALKLL